MTVIALDPGISTGCAIHVGERINISSTSTTGTVKSTTSDYYMTAVITNPKGVWDVIQTHEPTVVVFENFASGGLISKDGQATIRLIGAIELACYIKNITTVLQFPQERYPFMDQARDMIKQQKKTPISHEVDALAHLLLFEHRLEAGILDRIVQGRRRSYE